MKMEKLHESHFGKYKCQATNSLGTTSKTIEITGFHILENNYFIFDKHFQENLVPPYFLKAREKYCQV